MKKNFLFISCEEAKHICDKVQYEEASTWERIKLGLRLFWCNVTRSYSKNNNKLTKSIKNAEVHCLKTEERIQLQNQFDAALTKQKQDNKPHDR